MRKISGKNGGKVKLGIGDDSAVIRDGRGGYILWAQDMIVDGVHFRSGRDPYQKIGRKAVAVNISDIAAMGGRPEYISVSLGLPKASKPGSVRALAKGISGICREYGISIIGGDTVRSDRLVIDVSIIGKARKDQLAVRSGAGCNDAVLVTGPVRNGRKTHLDFTPRLKESRYLAGRKINSMIDVSDGIAPDLLRVCSASGTGCVVFEEKIPLEKGLVMKDALYYGESFELLFTMKKKDAERVVKAPVGHKFYIIGEMTEKKKGCRIMDGKGHFKFLRFEGYKHL